MVSAQNKMEKPFRNRLVVHSVATALFAKQDGARFVHSACSASSLCRFQFGDEPIPALSHGEVGALLFPYRKPQELGALPMRHSGALLRLSFGD